MKKQRITPILKAASRFRAMTLASGLMALAPAMAEFAIFDSVTDSIALANGTTLGTTATIEAVFALTSTGGGGFYFEQVDAQEHKALSARGTGLNGIGYAAGAIVTGLDASATVTTRVFHHAAWVRDGTQERLYLDGVMVGSRSVTNADIGDAANMAFAAAIGAGRYSSGTLMEPGFIGVLDSIRVSNTARYSGATITAPSGDMTSDANTQLLMNFDLADVAGNVVTDVSGNGRNGTLGATFPGATKPVIMAASPLNQRPFAGDLAPVPYSMSTDGVNDYASVPHHAVFDALESGDEVTFEGWIYMRAFPSGTGFALFDKHEATGDFGWHMLNDSATGPYFYSNSTSVITSPGSLAQIPVNEWAHMAVTLNQVTLEAVLYKNGEEIRRTTLPGRLLDTAGEALFFGFSPSGADEFLNGNFSEVRFWNRVLSGAEIRQRMFTQVTGRESGLASAWSMDEGSGSTLGNRVAGAPAGAFQSASASPVWSTQTPPVMRQRQHERTVVDTAVLITLRGSDPDGDALAAKIKSLPTNGELFQHDGSPITAPGTMVSDANNRVRYVPAGGFTGLDTLTFSMSDATLESADALVRIQVTTSAVTRTTWSAGDDFFLIEKPDDANDTSNPNVLVPEWSYGTRTVVTGTGFTALTPPQHSDSSVHPDVEGYGFDNSGGLLVHAGAVPFTANFGSGPLQAFQPREMWVQPGGYPSGTKELPVVRWTAPYNGVFAVNATWRHIDPNGGDGVSANVVVNGTSVFAQNLLRTSTTTFHALTLNAGDLVDFVTGNVSGVTFDSAGFTARITAVRNVYDAGKWFARMNGNPNWLWQYGAKASATGALTPFTLSDIFNAVPNWHFATTNFGVPLVSSTGDTAFGIHPSSNTSPGFSTVRFTTPTTGRYRVFGSAVTVSGGDGITTHLVRGGLQIAGVSVAPSSSTRFDRTVDLVAGQTLDLVVGAGVGQNFDSTTAQFLVMELPEPQPNTIAHYRFEDGPAAGAVGAMLDSGPYQIHGTTAGTLAHSTERASTPEAGAFSLDARGDSNYGEIPDTSFLHLQGDWTVEMFFKADVPYDQFGSTGFSTMAVKLNTTVSGDFMGGFEIDNGHDGIIGASVSFGSGTGVGVASTSNTRDGQWHHVALVMDRDVSGTTDELRIFVDGVLQGSKQGAWPELFYGNQPLYIGAGNFNGAAGSFRRNFDGFIDEVRISSAALTPAHFLSNLAPTAITLDDDKVNENSPTGTVVGLLEAADPDPATTHSFALVAGSGDSGNSSFEISGAELRTAAVFDFETQSSYSIRMRVTNSAGESLDQVLVVQVNDLASPSGLTLEGGSVAENMPAGTVVGTVSATDPTPGDGLTYSLVTGAGATDNARFAIVGDELRTAQVLDFETMSAAQSVRVRVTDDTGEFTEEVFSVTVLDQGPLSLSLSAATVAEGQPAGTAVGTLSAVVTPEGTAVASFTKVGGVGSTDNGLFTIDGATLRTAAVTDFEAASSRSIRVRATDARGETKEQVLVIAITDENDTPVISNIANLMVQAGVVSSVVNFTVNDEDTGAAGLVVTATSSNQALVPDAGLVAGGSDGSRTLTISPASFVTGGTTLTVTVSDGTLTASDTFVFTVNDQPVISNLAFNSQPLNATLAISASGNVTVAATDSQGVTKVDFFFSQGGGARIKFATDSNAADGFSGRLAVAQLPDGEYEITATASDADGGSGSISGMLNLTLAPPVAPVVTAPADGLRTDKSSLTVTGTADPESRVRVMRGAETLAGPTPPAANGSFSLSLNLVDGMNDLTVLAGNRAGDSPAVERHIEYIREFPQLSVTTATPVMGEDEVKLCTVSVSPVQPTELTVVLSTSLASRIAVPASVTIPPNQSQVSFNISGVQNEVLDPPMSARVSASGSFLRSGFVDVQVLDDDWPVLTLTLESPWVRENDGAQATFLNVARDQARGFAQTVFLSSSVPSAALLPSSVEIPANQTSVRVPVTSVNDSAEDGPQTTEFRAWVVESRNQSIVSESAPVALEVQDDEGPTLELTIAPTVLHEGGSFVDGGVVRLPSISAGSTVVTLLAAPAGLITLPASVTVPAGQLSAAFSLSIPSTTANEGPRPVRLSCSSPGVTSGVRSVIVTDVPMPDFVPSLIQVPPDAESNTSVNVVFRIENRGTTAVTGRQVHRVFLSRDRALGDDLLVAQVVSTDSLPAGGFIERTESIRLPQEEGGFHVLVQADSEAAAEEASEVNNLAVSLQPISVAAGYSATASVSGSMFPEGSVVPITGQASREGGAPVSRLPVKLRIAVGGIHRDVVVTTAQDGSFAHTFTPLPGECGNYSVTAAHPAAAFGAAQDSFSLVAIKTVSVPEVSFDDGGSAAATVLLTNPAGVPLHNLAAALVSAVPGVTVTLSLPEGAVLDGSSPVPLSIQAVGQAGVSGVRTLVIDVTTAEGVTLRLNVKVTIHPLRPQLVFNPGRVSQSVLRGGQKTAVIELENTGRAATGNLQVLLPDLPMLSLATPELIPSLAPGGKAQVNLLITPPADAPLTVTNGQILLFSPEMGTMSIPFDIRVTSDSRGDLTVEVTDEFTYFSDEQPLVEGARVRLRDPVTGVEVRPSQTTTTTGTAVFSLLQEGYYELEVSAPKHATFISDILVQPGPDNKQVIFITREMVSYLWTVTESEVTDRYNIKVDTTFETNVPAPVVTLTPGQVDLKLLTAPGDSMQVNLVLTNQGFIGAQNGRFSFSSHPWYVVEPLVSEVGMIQGKQTISIPTIIRRVGPVPAELASQAAEAASRDAGGDAVKAPAAGDGVVVPCTLSGEFYYDYECGGETVPKKIPIAFSNVDGDCAGGLASDPGMLPKFFDTAFQPLPLGSRGGPGRPAFASVQFSLPQACDCFEFEKKFKDEMELGPVADALKEALSKALPPPLALGEVEVKLEGDIEIKACCPPGVELKGTGKAVVSVEILVGPQLPELDPEFETPEWAEVEIGVSGVAGAKITLTGEGEVSIEKECNGEPNVCLTLTISGGLELGPMFEIEVEAKDKNSGKEFKGSFEAKAVLTGNVFASAAYCTGKPVEAKAGASIGFQVKFGGELEHEDEKKPFGLDISKSITAGDEQPEDDEPSASPVLADARAAEGNEVNADVVVLPPSHYPGVGSAEVVGRAISASDEQLLTMARVPTGQGGVCAQVKMQLKQDMVLTRQGFEAVLQLTNNQPAESLSNIGFVMDIRDEDGQPANDRFQLRAPDVTGFGSIDGTGTLAAKSTGSSRWILVPNDDAAPFSEKTYFVGGQISYTEQGRSLSIPVAGVSIKVRPNAALKVSYFHQRDVFADDPHTEDVTEPAEPFYLGVLVKNDGFGEARNVKLTSGQPVIVDNEKGLAVQFQQETASVNGEPARPGSTLSFGALAPQGRAVGVFGMRGSLLGQFNSYDASFEHLDGNGDPRLSILKSVEIHEMKHLVQANRPGDDAQPDFLTNDIGDSDHLPDTLHHSTGAVDPVVLVTNAGTNSTPSSFLLTIPLTANIPAGQWGYVRIQDPSNGTMQITRVRRSDGVDLIVGRNVWTTNRTMPGLGQRAVVENILHMLDFGGTGQYEITFQMPPSDAAAPISSVAVLPAQSSVFIPVTWSGIDLMSGVSEFDIFVSDNGGPFTLWRERTRLTGATYEGVLGHAYSFFSIATDWAGNREPAPSTPDATTTVSIVNDSPVIAENGDLHVIEGQQLSALIQAEDPDGPLLYELMPGAPQGMVLSQSGVLSWLPGEAHGGRSYPVTVRVTDRGLPQASSLQTLAVIVEEDNQIPVPVMQEPRFLTAGESLVIGLSASDADLPAQQLSWQLVGGPVDGLTLDAATGLLSLVTEPSPTPRTISTVAAVADNFSPAGVALVPLNFFIAPGGGTTTTVNPVNQAPTLAAIANPAALPKNAGPQTLQLSGISAGPSAEVQNVSITAVSSNPALIPHPAVSYVSPGTTGSLTFIPVEGVSGTAEITVTVTDDGGTANGGVNSFQRSFVVTIHEGFQTVSFAASSFTAGQDDASVKIAVTREGSSAAASVTVSTSNGTSSTVPPFVGAVAGVDYTAQSLTVQFAENEMSSEITLQLSPRTGKSIPNKRFKVSLVSLGVGMVPGDIPVAEVRILANDSVKPTLSVLAPAATTTSLSTISPYLVKGTAGDGRGIDRVEVVLNGGPPVNAVLGAATAATSVPWSLPIAPLDNMSNVLSVTAYDLRGNASTTVTRSFHFLRRYELVITRLVPEGVLRDSAGGVSLAATPTAHASSLTPATANADPRRTQVVPGASLKVTAVAKPGHVFSHWENLPGGAVALGNVVTFVMPSEDEGLTAVFVENPFLAQAGESNTFCGLLQPFHPTPFSKDSLGMITFTLSPTTGAFSGRILISGISKPIAGTIYGNGSVLYNVGTVKTYEMSVGDRRLELTYGTAGMVAALFKDMDLETSGVARRAVYSSNNPVPDSYLNDKLTTTAATNNVGRFTGVFASKAQSPARLAGSYPQGDGYFTSTLSLSGNLALTGVLADGTSFTLSSPVVGGDEVPVFVQLPTPGAAISVREGCLGGTVLLNASQPDSDMTAVDLRWIRPSVIQLSGTTATARATQIYTDGWPSGITVDMMGALYDRKLDAQNALGLGPVDPVNGNGRLVFSDAGLLPDVSVTRFNIQPSATAGATSVVKIPATNSSFSLSITQSSGLFSGTFTPNWTQAVLTKPAFKGVLLQKGASAGGYGFFHSNRSNDTDPEAGRVILDGGEP